MHFFQIPTQSLRKRATSWHVRFSPLFLVAFLMICLVVTIAFVPAANKAHASPILTQKIQLSSLDMIDQQHGWAFGGTGTHVFTTHQGPEHWVDVTPPLLIQEPNDAITTSFFQNATHGYIGLLSQKGNIVMLSTSNSGRTWQTTSFTIPGTFPGEATIIQIQFIDAQHGWLSFIRDQRNPGEFDFLMMRTTNGGKTWQTVVDTYTNPTSLPIPYSMTLHFTFVNPLDGWATGVGLSADVYLEATHDGGKTWSQSNILPIKGGNNVNFTQDHGPYWQNSQNGALFVLYSTDTPHLTAYRTLDGGKSWILGPSTTTTSFQELSNLSFLNAREGWSFGLDGTNRYVIHHTSTSGLKWDIFYPAGLIRANVDQVAQNLTFINTTTGWVIIKDGQGNYHLFQTNTGGHTWQALHPVTD